MDRTRRARQDEAIAWFVATTLLARCALNHGGGDWGDLFALGTFSLLACIALGRSRGWHR